MELTYAADWFDDDSASTLDIGTYEAVVFDSPTRNGIIWRVTVNGFDDDGEHDISRIAQGRAGDRDAAKQAAEDTIRRHHARLPVGQ